jgi:hypothetical protein
VLIGLIDRATTIGRPRRDQGARRGRTRGGRLVRAGLGARHPDAARPGPLRPTTACDERDPPTGPTRLRLTCAGRAMRTSARGARVAGRARRTAHR